MLNSGSHVIDRLQYSVPFLTGLTQGHFYDGAEALRLLHAPDRTIRLLKGYSIANFPLSVLLHRFRFLIRFPMRHVSPPPFGGGGCARLNGMEFTKHQRQGVRSFYLRCTATHCTPLPFGCHFSNRACHSGLIFGGWSRTPGA